MRARPRAWRGPLAVAAAFIAGTATARIAWADREVGVPPGTSLDWVAEMPRRHPTELYRVPGTSATPLVSPAGSGQTMSRPVSHPRTMSEVGPTTAMGYARVTTVDITGEVRWTSERPPFDLVEG